MIHLNAVRLRYYMQQYTQLNAEVAGPDLTTLADRRANVENLLRHTTAAYRNRELKDHEAELQARLQMLIREDGILSPADLEYREPGEGSASALPKAALRSAPGRN